MNWKKATIEQVKQKCEKCIADKSGIAVSPAWLLALIREVESLRKGEKYALRSEVSQ